MSEVDGDDGLAGHWPHPISGWVKGDQYMPANHKHHTPDDLMGWGWQPVSHVPPSYTFDPGATP